MNFETFLRTKMAIAAVGEHKNFDIVHDKTHPYGNVFLDHATGKYYRAESIFQVDDLNQLRYCKDGFSDVNYNLCPLQEPEIKKIIAQGTGKGSHSAYKTFLHHCGRNCEVSYYAPMGRTNSANQTMADQQARYEELVKKYGQPSWCDNSGKHPVYYWDFV